MPDDAGLSGSPPIRGVLNVNKPGGITSYDVIRRLKPIFNAARSVGPGARRRPLRLGHAGTLDPLASGVLLVLVGEATKVVDCLQLLDKEYVARVRLGLRTDTDDVTGGVLEEKPAADVTPEQILAVLPGFIGEIEQTPPVYSALKVEGRRSSDRARQGDPVALKPRRIFVREIAASEFAPPAFTLQVIVSRGTYVRALVRDIGARLGCGATLEALVRTRIGPFRVADAVELEPFDPARISSQLIPINDALSFLPRAVVGPDDARRLWQGKPLGPDELTWTVPPAAHPEGPVRIVDEAGRMLVIARLAAGQWRTARGVYADI